MRELTAGEIKKVLQLAETAVEKNDPPGVLELLFPDAKIPPAAVAISAGKDISELEAMEPSKLEGLIRKAEEINPFFLRMMEPVESLLEKSKQNQEIL